MKYRLSAGLVLVSAASLMFEIALTRVYAIAQGHHFAFVAIAMALLGIGAAGTLTATSRRLAGSGARATAIGWAGALFALTAVGAYVTADRIPLDTYRIGADASQLVWLALFFIVAAVPFTCAGVAVVAALRHSPARARVRPTAPAWPVRPPGRSWPLPLLASDWIGRDDLAGRRHGPWLRRVVTAATASQPSAPVFRLSLPSSSAP